MTQPTAPKELPQNDLEFSRSVAEGLTQKLASVDPALSDPERKLLLTIFSAAGDCVHSPATGPDQPNQTAADLKTQLFNAFVPGAGNPDDVYLIHDGARVSRIKPAKPIPPSSPPVPPSDPPPPAGPSVPPSSPPGPAQP